MAGSPETPRWCPQGSSASAAEMPHVHVSRSLRGPARWTQGLPGLSLEEGPLGACGFQGALEESRQTQCPAGWAEDGAPRHKGAWGRSRARQGPAGTAHR